MGQSRPLFGLFSSFSHSNFNKTNCKKLRCCAWYSNPELQDGRHRQNHEAMAVRFFSQSPISKNAFRKVLKSVKLIEYRFPINQCQTLLLKTSRDQCCKPFLHNIICEIF